MALCAVIDKTGFERGLNPRDPPLVDIGFFLFLGLQLNTQVIKLLTINQSDPQLFLLSGVD